MRLSKENKLCQMIEVKLAPLVRRIAFYDKPTGKVVGKKSRFIGYDDNGMLTSVEGLVVQHFALPENGSWHGIHCEGRMFRFLFGLIFWDIIFADDIPGVFQTPFQNAPLDLHSAGHRFYENRAMRIETALKKSSRSLPAKLACSSGSGGINIAAKLASACFGMVVYRAQHWRFMRHVWVPKLYALSSALLQ